MKPDTNMIEQYNRNQKKISKLKVKDVKLAKYIEEATNKYSLDKEINLVHIKKIIEEWKDKPLSKVLRVLMKDFDKYCCIFEYVQKKLYVDLNLQNFYGFDFYLDI